MAYLLQRPVSLFTRGGPAKIWGLTPAGCQIDPWWQWWWGRGLAFQKLPAPQTPRPRGKRFLGWLKRALIAMRLPIATTPTATLAWTAVSPKGMAAPAPPIYQVAAAAAAITTTLNTVATGFLPPPPPPPPLTPCNTSMRALSCGRVSAHWLSLISMPSTRQRAWRESKRA